MATVPLADGRLAEPEAATRRSRFYLGLSLFCLLFGVAGFAPTYFLQVPAGTFRGPAILHVHAFFATAWLVMLVLQSWQITRGRVVAHRTWGLFGIALATLIFASGIAVAITGLNERYAQGFAERGQAFLIAPVFAATVFYGCFGAAIATVRKPEWHRRLMFVATAAMLLPAAARFFFLARNGWEAGLRPGSLPPAPVAATYAGLVVVSLVPAIGALHDWLHRRRVHPAWWIGLAVLLVGGWFRAPLSDTGAWHAFADALARIAEA